MTNRVRHWIHGLGAAFIGGGAGAITAAVAANLIKPDAFNLSGNLKSTLLLMGSCFIINGLLNSFSYLKQSPLPPDDITPLPINKTND